MLRRCSQAGTDAAAWGQIVHMKTLRVALDSQVTDPVAGGDIPPTLGLADGYSDTSTGESDKREYTRPWSKGDRFRIVEVPAFTETGAN